MAPAGAAELIRRAIALVNAAADGADDEELTPSVIAEVIRDAREAPDLGRLAGHERAQRFLGEALDAVADGMPADYVAMILYAALGALGEAARED
ncbi:MAG TPA: hypothetical protein VF134_09385 [Candidatus Dormibacteraeota bacterium]